MEARDPVKSQLDWIRRRALQLMRRGMKRGPAVDQAIEEQAAMEELELDQPEHS